MSVLYLKAPSLQTVAIKHEKLLLNTSKEKRRKKSRREGRRGRRGEEDLLATRQTGPSQSLAEAEGGEVFLRRGHLKLCLNLGEEQGKGVSCQGGPALSRVLKGLVWPTERSLFAGSL